MKEAVTSVSRYGCTRGRICRSSNGESDLAGGARRPPGSIAGSLVLIKLGYPTEMHYNATRTWPNLGLYAFPHQRSTASVKWPMNKDWKASNSCPLSLMLI